MKNFWISRFAATDGALEFARGNKLVFDVGYEGHYPRKKKGYLPAFYSMITECALILLPFILCVNFLGSFLIP